MAASKNTPKRLAQEVAVRIGFDHWEDDLVTREIGSAEDLNTAAQRLVTILQDANTGLKLILAELAKG